MSEGGRDPALSAIRRARAVTPGVPAVLSRRGIWAVATIALWIGALEGRISIPSAFDPIGWHAHEMLFGFVVAAIAGFPAHRDPEPDG